MSFPDMPLLNTDDEMDVSCDDSLADPNFELSDSTSTSETDSDNDTGTMAKRDSTALFENNQLCNSNNMDDRDLMLSSENNQSNDQLLSPVRTEQVLVTKETPKTRKMKRNLGKAYTTLAGKQIKAKEVQLLHPCIRNCRNKVSPEIQEAIFTQYWILGNFNLRVAFVAGLIDIQDKKTTSNIKSSTAPRNRQFSYCYFLNVKGLRTQVCQKCFKASLGETDRFLKTVIAKKIESPGTTIAQDLRGTGPSKKKISSEKFEEVVGHIKSFPAYESHYSRRHTSKMYLNSDLSLSKMYRLYLKADAKPVSLSKYSEIFRTLRLKFKKPQIDTCTKCDVFSIKIKASTGTELEILLKEQKHHHEMAERAYNSKKNDIASISATSKVFAFDLQQCLPTPYLRSSICYYKRQLYTFNLTIHDCGSGKLEFLRCI